MMKGFIRVSVPLREYKPCSVWGKRYFRPAGADLVYCFPTAYARGLHSYAASRLTASELSTADNILGARRPQDSRQDAGATNIYSVAVLRFCQCDQANQIIPATSATPITASNWWKY